MEFSVAFAKLDLEQLYALQNLASRKNIEYASFQTMIMIGAIPALVGGIIALIFLYKPKTYNFPGTGQIAVYYECNHIPFPIETPSSGAPLLPESVKNEVFYSVTGAKIRNTTVGSTYIAMSWIALVGGIISIIGVSSLMKEIQSERDSSTQIAVGDK